MPFNGWPYSSISIGTLPMYQGLVDSNRFMPKICNIQANAPHLTFRKVGMDLYG
jgi:hypothetical protein